MTNNYVETPELPSRLGYEIAGMVEEVGPDVTEFKVGDRLSSIPAFSIGDYANFGETAILPTRGLMRTPDNFTPAQGAAERIRLLHWLFRTARTGAFAALPHCVDYGGHKYDWISGDRNLHLLGDEEAFARAKAFIAAGLADGSFPITIDRELQGLESLPDALRYMQSNQAAGKIAVTL